MYLTVSVPEATKKRNVSDDRFGWFHRGVDDEPCYVPLTPALKTVPYRPAVALGNRVDRAEAKGEEERCAEQ
jgi:hypothetical protein